MLELAQFLIPFLAVDGGISAMLIMTAASIAISVAAGALAKKPRAPIVDERPQSIATRGAFLPYLIGRRKVGHIVTWVGRYGTQRASANALGKFSQWFWWSSIAQTAGMTYNLQGAVHALAIGPVYALWAIRMNGQIIFEGPITQETHPSGSQLSCVLGVFYIFWGEPTQPINTNIGNSDAIGINSRWPYVCYVVWDQALLGTSTNWPMLDYELETRINDAVWPPTVSLPSSQAYIPSTPVISGVLFSSFNSFNDGPASVANFTILDDQTFYFQAGALFQLTGNSLPNGLYPIYDSIYSPLTGYTTVYINQNISGSNRSGTVEPYFVDNNDGINPAHILAQLLFAPFPYGMGFDPTYYDIPSLDALGSTMEAEDFVASVIIQDGEEAESVIARILQDMGAVMSWDPSQGKFTFILIRQPDLSTIPAIPDDALCPALPEIEQLMLERPADKLIYVFSDREHEYKDMTLAIDDDGQALFLDTQRARKVSIPSTTVFTCASQIAERRALEELSGGAKIEVTTNRQTRLIRPGDACTISGIIPVLRVTEVEIPNNSREVKLTCVTDFYSCPESEFTQQGAPLPTSPTAVPPELFTFIELPAFLSNLAAPVALIALRIRKSQTISRAEMWLSGDDVNFIDSGPNANLATGGTLISGMLATDPYEQPTGPTITLIGPDIGLAQDLTSQPGQWRAGRQLAVIDNEIFFVQKLTALGGSSYRLDGLIRARYDTQPAAHGAGANVFVFQYLSNHNTTVVVDQILIGPDSIVYCKDQPIGSEPLALAFVQAQTVTVYGENVRPMPMANLRANGGINGWKSGADIVLAWCHRSTYTRGTGAGMQPAGSPQGAGASLAPYFSPVQGLIQVQITDTVGNVKRAFSTDQFGYTYSNADLVSDFGSEPSAFLVNVWNQSGPNSSPTLSIQVNLY